MQLEQAKHLHYSVHSRRDSSACRVGHLEQGLWVDSLSTHNSPFLPLLILFTSHTTWCFPYTSMASSPPMLYVCTALFLDNSYQFEKSTLPRSLPDHTWFDQQPVFSDSKPCDLSTQDSCLGMLCSTHTGLSSRDRSAPLTSCIRMHNWAHDTLQSLKQRLRRKKNASFAKWCMLRWAHSGNDYPRV